jgi:hypothetical protein
MKKLAFVALCFFSSFVSASDIEEVKVIGKEIQVVMIALSDNHKRNPITGNWHYVGMKEKEKTEA